MKTFQFKLQGVLQVRQRELEVHQQRFAGQLNRMMRLEQISTELDLSIEEAHQKFESTEIDPLQQRTQFAYIQYLKEQRQNLHKEIHNEKQILETLRRNLNDAYIQKKSLEILKDKKQKSYYQWVDKCITEEMNDLVITRISGKIQND